MKRIYQNSKELFSLLFSLFLFFSFFTPNVSADSTVAITNYYNTTTGEICNLTNLSGNCSAFKDWSSPTYVIPAGNYIYTADSTGYGGWGVNTASIATSFISTFTQSSVGVARIPAHLSAVSATYVCTGPTGTTMRTVPAGLNTGSRAGFVPVDTTGQDCVVTINFNQTASNPAEAANASGGNLYACQANACVLDNSGGYFSDSTCGGQCGNFGSPASISISASPTSATANYGIQNTSYFDITVTKNGNFGADIVPWCEALISGGSTAGECSFVDGSGNPIPRTKYGQPAGSAAFTRYPSYYMEPNVSSVNLRLAVRNYDQYGGYSAAKTHIIPVQAGLIEASSLSGATLVCNGSCIAGVDLNYIVQNAAVCQATAGVSATSPAAANRTFDLSWLAVSGASSYTVEVRDQTSCVQPGCGPLILNTTVSGTSVNVPYGGDVAGLTNKRFGYVIRTNYSPSRNICSSVGSVLVSGPGSGGGGPSGSVTLLCNGVQNATINSGQDCNLTWTSVNTVTNSCVASGNWSGGSKPTAGSQNMPNITSNKSYTLTCDVVGGGTAFGTANVSVTGAPSATCPAPTPYLNLDKTQINLGELTQIRPPAGYICPSYSSSNSGVASVSGSSITGNASGFASISASGCTFSGLSCPVNPVIVTVQSPPTSNSFSLSPTTLNFSATLNSSTGYLNPVTCQDITITNTSPIGSGNFSVAPTYYVEYNNFPSFSIDNQVQTSGRYWLNDGSFIPNTGSICILDHPSVRSPGNYQEVITYAGYPNSGTNKITEERTLLVNLNVSGSICSSGNVVLNPGSIQKGGNTAQATTPGFTGCSFASSNTGVATVNGSGVVTSGSSSGSSNISATNCIQTSNGATGCSLSPATILVTEATANYSFTVSSALVFSANEGSLPSPSTKTITVTNNGNQTLNITRTYNMTTNGVNWGNVDSPSFSLAPGASRVVNVNITSMMPYATYDGMVTFSDPNAGQKAVPVTYIVSPGSSTRTLNVTPNWCGTVTSAPVGISCGSSCNFNFNIGTAVTLTATPKPQCLFIGWLGDCAGQDNTCDLTITDNKNTTPIFGLKPINYQEF